MCVHLCIHVCMCASVCLCVCVCVFKKGNILKQNNFKNHSYANQTKRKTSASGRQNNGKYTAFVDNHPLATLSKDIKNNLLEVKH